MACPYGILDGPSGGIALEIQVGILGGMVDGNSGRIMLEIQVGILGGDIPGIVTEAGVTPGMYAGVLVGK